MRRCFTLLTVLVLCASSGCDDKNKEEVADVIVLSRSSVAFAQKGGTTTVAVATPSDWKVSCPDDWVTLASEEGLLTISAASNTTDNVRNSKITVETAGDKQEIAVHQAFSWETVLLSTTASEEISLDSEGESVLFTVVSNGQWSVTSDADWVSVESDPVSGTVRVGAPRNPDAHRNATLTVRATKGSATESCKVTVSQISREENPYYQMLGYYGLHAENWYYGREPIGVSGTGTFCTVEEKEYRKSFYIKNLFLTGTVVEATYDKNTQTMSIELGRLCYTREISPTVSRFHYLYSINMQGGGFHNGMLTGRLGEGYNDDADETRKAILLNGFESPYTTLGIIGYQEQQWLSFGDLYYATGHDVPRGLGHSGRHRHGFDLRHPGRRRHRTLGQHLSRIETLNRSTHEKIICTDSFTARHDGVLRRDDHLHQPRPGRRTVRHCGRTGHLIEKHMVRR